MSIEMQPGDEQSRLRDHLMESGLTLRPDVPKDGNCLFHAVSDQLVRTGSTAISHSQLRQDVVGYLRQHPHNEKGDHLRAFVRNLDWEGYLQQMSRDGVWGDHIVLQALASMLGRDIRIVSSIDADNYITILSPMGNQQVTTGPPLLLGHYAENHYASLDGDSNKTSQPGVGPCDIIIRAESRAKGSGSKPVVLMINDEYGTSRGGVSTIHRQMAGMLVSKGAVVYSTILGASRDDEDDAAADGVQLIFPTTSDGDKRKPSLDWLTWEHKSHYPNLPSEVGFVVGHVNITSRAARQIKEQRLPNAKLVQVTHVIPEDTSHYKGDEKVMSIGEESDSILEDLKHADVIFSVGPYMYDYYKSQTREIKPHHEFLPKPSDVFSKVQVKHVNTETKVVLSIGRVMGVEILKGYDLVAKAMSMVIDHLPNTKWRVRGVSHEDFPESKKLIQANVEKGKFNFTPLKYATQRELSEDMQKVDVVLMPSRAEPFGLVALEAIAAGVPVLVSHKSGLAWFLRSQDPEFDRLIVEIADDDNEAAKTLAKRIIKVLKDGKREFQAARRLKETLLASKYWDASHSKFLEAFGL
ncbi:uncharacterized protein LOC118421765 [Branchiostoma floridae]|uniref:Uncharacterized protein LOC118421765 n=1 Tax=Branchiostoma floridae TaxID=7739 RepID=A0A9J7N018_BRAFL|nr:uncharacterized protein LOC118421765 [Branchiostoma floridae]